MRPDRNGVPPLLALLLFLNGSLCFCEGHDVAEHGHAALPLDADDRAPYDHGEDECVQLDVLGMRERGFDGDAPPRESLPASVLVRSRTSGLDSAGASTGNAGPTPVHAPPRFLTHCALLC